MINRYKIHRIVEYIKLFDFEFETFDVLEKVDSVLAYYDLLDVELNEEEHDLLIHELLPFAEQFEFSEVSRLVAQDDPLLSGIRENVVNLKIQAIERKLRKASSTKLELHDFPTNVALA
jgi:hypothetical protein